jgi:hypothetical protein
MRLFSEMIFFVVVCLLILTAIYGVQAAFLSDGASASAHWRSQANGRVPLYSWGFSESTELPLAPMRSAGPILAPAPFPPSPGGPGDEVPLRNGDAFFGAKFREL